MTVVECESQQVLLRRLHHLQGVPASGTWYFRGQARASWKLEPALFRLGLSKEQDFEEELLISLRSSASLRSTIPDRLVGDNDYLLALGQHYGCPTRMLDWTLSPLQAAYFAATDSVRGRIDEPLAVYAIADLNTPHQSGSVIVRPATGGNENLTAQLGMLCKHDWACRDFWDAEYELPRTRNEPEITGSLRSRYIRFELPACQAANLVRELDRRGVDGASAFPGPHGFARRAADRAWVGEWVASGRDTVDSPE